MSGECDKCGEHALDCKCAIMADIKWINPKERKPEGEVFWALTSGRNEQGYRDWEIIRLWNDDFGDYRTLDCASSYRLPNTSENFAWYSIIYAWLPLDSISVNDKDFA